MALNRDAAVLPRGGAIVETSVGSIQFGAVPETIKDTLGLEGGVPQIYVLPPTFFAIERGISFADLEFPVYYNFFCKQRSVIVLCDARQKRLLQPVLREAVFGPTSLDITHDLPTSRPPRSIPDLEAELAFFRKNPWTGTELSLDDMVEFRTFDREGNVELGEVRVQRLDDGSFCVYDGDTLVGRVAKELELPAVHGAVRRNEPFIPPHFGLTFIGTGHGFDPTTKTSGFIIWLNGRGILVDPPVDSTEWLREHDVNPKFIDGIILTHCHADHDSGTLQKILCEGRIKLYATRTVFGSFERKYRTLIGLDRKRFQDLFDYVPLTIGEPLRICGGEFWFHYGLHSVPAVGFELYFAGKSMVYTSDTLYDPEVIERLHLDGVLDEARRDELINFPWHHDVVIHEAGVAPIHTQVRLLCDLPPDVKERMFLIHTNPKDIPPGSGLQVAPQGIDHTLVIEANPSPKSESIEMLDALARVDLFREFTVEKAGEFLGMVQRRNIAAGEQIIEKGTPGDCFYMILSGRAAVRDGTAVSKVYGPYDYFGETAIILDIPRTADVYAETEMVVLTLERHDFLYFLRGSSIADQLRRLARMRSLESWELLEAADALGPLTATQKTQLQSIMDDWVFDEGATISKQGDPQKECYLVASGEVEVTRDGESVARIVKGGFLGIVPQLYNNGKLPVGFTATKPAVLYRLPRRGLIDFLKRNPGVYVRLSHQKY